MADVQEEVVIVGGGLSGLTAAWRLQQAGVSSVVLEADERPGGRVKTIRLGDCVIDTGAVGMLGSYDEMFALAAELGIGDEFVRRPVCMGIPRDGTLHVLDMGRLSTVLGTDLLSRGSKWRLRKLGGPMLKLWRRMNFESMAALSDVDNESVESFARRELNSELYDYLIGPMIRALWQRDPADTPAVDLFCSLKVFAPTMYGCDGGLQRLPDTLATRVRTQTGALVHEVDDGPQGVRIVYECEGVLRERHFKQGIVALPPSQAAPLLKPVQSDLLRALGEQPYTCSVNVHLALSKRLGGEVLVMFPPEAEAPDLTTVVFEHNKSPGRAPADKGALSLYWRDSWSRARMGVTDDQIVADAIEQTRRVVPDLDASMVEAAHVERWPLSGVCRSIGGTQAIAEIEKIADGFHNLALAGDYFVLSGMNSAVVSGRRAAQRILALRNASHVG